MKQNEKASLMRVISDLIQADGIIDMQEIEYLETLRTKYKIMPDDEQRADHLTFAEAVTTLAEAEAVLRHQLVTDFAEVAMSDNYCARAEALLMLALRYCLVVACLLYTSDAADERCSSRSTADVSSALLSCGS